MKPAPLLTCGSGTPWQDCHPCDKCRAFVEQACADMALDRLAGLYDAEGYTPNERKAQHRRQAEASK